MNPRVLLAVLVRAIGVFFLVNGAIGLIAVAVGPQQVWEQLAPPAASFLAGLLLLVRGDAVARWAFRSRDDV